MKLTFLGTAAAEGFPDPFCACTNCEDARVEGGPALRMRSSALIDDLLLIDFGPDIAKAALQFDVRLISIPFALQTHPHSDHLDGLTIFARAAMCQVESLEVTRYFCSQTAIARMDELLGLGKRDRTFSDPAVQSEFSFNIETIAPWQETHVGHYRVQTVAANHDIGVEAMLFAIEDTNTGDRLFYGTDTGSLPGETWSRLAGLGWRFDILILDHTFGFGARTNGHLNQEQFLEEVEAARAAGAIDDDTRVFATHIAHHSNPAHGKLVARAQLHGYDIAYDGLTIDTADKGSMSGTRLRSVVR